MPPSPRTLVAPFPQKSHTATRVAIFGDPVYLGHTILRAPHSPFLQKQRCLQIGVRCAKARFCLRERIAREICFKLIKQISANLGETRAAFPSCHVATRRRRASGARSLPPSPRTLVPQKSHTAMRVAIFGGPVVFKGTHIIKCRNFTPSVSRGVGKLSAKAKSAVFAFASNYFNYKPQTHGKSQRGEIFVNKAAEPRRKRAIPDRALRETCLVRSR